MNVFRIAFTADLHGDEEKYRQLSGYALSHDIDSVIIGGDIGPKRFPLYQPNLSKDYYITLQADFLKSSLQGLLSPLKEGGIEIYIIEGNDDVKVNHELLKRHDGELYNLLNSKRFSLTDDFEIIGYPYVPITPFRIKDWEKYDLSEPPESPELKARYEMRVRYGYRLDGFKSSKDGWKDFVFDEGMATEDSIEKDLLRPEFWKDPKNTVYVMHTPPDSTNLDMVATGHVGSFAVRNFIERCQPYLTLHGHIHETVAISGKFSDRIGETLCMSAGNIEGEDLSVVVFDLYEPRKAKRITLDST